MSQHHIAVLWHWAGTSPSPSWWPVTHHSLATCRICSNKFKKCASLIINHVTLPFYNTFNLPAGKCSQKLHRPGHREVGSLRHSTCPCQHQCPRITHTQYTAQLGCLSITWVLRNKDSIFTCTQDKNCQRAYSEITRSREVFTILVKWHCHDTICRIKCFFHTITMMNINVNVHNSLVVSIIHTHSL